MQKILSFILVIGTAATMLSSCQKEVQPASQSTQTLALNQSNAAGTHGYDGGQIYNIELSANIPGVQGGGVWLWIALYSNGTGDYSGADCGHGGAGAAHDSGNVTWHYDGANIVINGVVLNGLDGFVATLTVPSKTGHYKGTLGAFITLPGFIPGDIGFSQLTVAP
jgi:hypothetical protein